MYSRHSVSHSRQVTYLQVKHLTSEQMKKLNLDMVGRRKKKEFTLALKVVIQQNKVCASDKLTSGAKAGLIKMMCEGGHL